jgi:hypothetical protein
MFDRTAADGDPTTHKATHPIILVALILSLTFVDT